MQFQYGFLFAIAERIREIERKLQTIERLNETVVNLWRVVGSLNNCSCATNVTGWEKFATYPQITLAIFIWSCIVTMVTLCVALCLCKKCTLSLHKRGVTRDDEVFSTPSLPSQPPSPGLPDVTGNHSNQPIAVVNIADDSKTRRSETPGSERNIERIAADNDYVGLRNRESGKDRYEMISVDTSPAQEEKPNGDSRQSSNSYQTLNVDEIGVPPYESIHETSEADVKT